MDRNPPSATERAAHEVAHGQRIAERAGHVWGWETAAGRVRAQQRGRFLVTYGGITPDTYLLEVGCGTGIFTAELARCGARIDAIDISPALLEKARVRPECGEVCFIQGDVGAAQVLRGPYDAVVGISVLHHLDLSRVLPVLLRVLKSGGTFVFSEPNMRNPQVWLERHVPWLKTALGVSPDETAFVRTRLAATLEHYGFTNVTVRPFDWLHPWTPKSLIPAVRRVGSILEKTPLVREISGSLLIVARKP